mmetsp:Transcript_26014/g.25239  ORF Transcript_26014/g.25239 Transcript_26014/m.25239 type:complete len:80 (-) Transcript_26014:293-532(-)
MKNLRLRIERLDFNTMTLKEREALQLESIHKSQSTQTWFSLLKLITIVVIGIVQMYMVMTYFSKRRLVLSPYDYVHSVI